MKRAHASSKRLGALEFAAALNGDDPKAFLKALKRFNKTVSREEKLALGGNVEESSGSEEEEEDNSDTPIKRQKLESWMQDSKSYNVPFVGTSVAKGDQGTVVVGTWPTGFLEAYLKSSPMAKELQSSHLIYPHGSLHRSLLKHKQKSHQTLSHLIHVAQLQALEHLVTAAIPMYKLERNMGIMTSETDIQDPVSSNHHKLVSTILKERLPLLLNLIKEQVHKPRQDLVAAALRVISNLAATSVSAARQVSRELDATLQPNTLRNALKQHKKKRNEKNQEKKDGEEQRHSAKYTVESQTASVELAATLLETGDAAVISYILTGGSKERKINPGILYLALRTGLVNEAFEYKTESDKHDCRDYFLAVSRLLRGIRQILLPNRRLLSQRALAELLLGEALERITHVASSCPNLPFTESNEVQSDAPIDSLESICIEAHHLLRILLSDKKTSPFLSRIHESRGMDKVATVYKQQVVRALIHLVNANGCLAMQQFVLNCVSSTPPLLPALFRTLSIPDLKQHGIYAFLSRLGLASRLMREGPLYVEPGVNQVLLLSVLPFQLKRNVWSTALHSTHSLLVAETLKLLTRILQRFQKVLEENNSVDKEALLDALVKRLPELQSTVAAVRTKFDPFDQASDSSSAVVTGFLCDLLIQYSEVIPNVLNAVKFDWVKLLPDNTANFVGSSPVLQLKLLRALEAIHNAQKKSQQPQMVSSGSCRLFLEIAMLSHQPQVYEFARKQALHVILSNVQRTNDREAKECLRYEASLWVDGMTPDCVAELCAALDKYGQVSFQHAITVAETWKTYIGSESMPSVCFSPLLTAALCNDKSSVHFALLANQVALKCLLYHQSPLALAAVISHAGSDSIRAKADYKSESDTLEKGQLLVRYTKSLCDFGTVDKQERSTLLQSAMQGLFSAAACQTVLASTGRQRSSESFRTHLLYQSSPESFGDDGVALLRQCLHMIVTEQDEPEHASVALSHLFLHLKSILTLVLEDADKAVRIRAIESVFTHPVVQQHRFSSWQSLEFEALAVTCASREKDLLSQSVSLLNVLRNVADEMANDLSKSTSEHDLLSRRSVRQRLLSLSMLIPFIHPEKSAAITEELLRLCCRSVSGKESEMQLPLSVGMSLHWLECCSSQQESCVESLVSMRLVFETWCELRRLVQAGLQHSELWTICQLLEDTMVKESNRGGDGMGSSLLYSLFLQMDPDELIDLCISGKDDAAKSPLSGDRTQSPAFLKSSCLLSCIMVSDCPRFAPSLVNKVMSGDAEDCRIRNDFQSNSLDCALSVILGDKSFRENGSFDNVLIAVARHVASILKGASDLRVLRQYKVIFEALSDVLRQSSPTIAIVDDLIDAASETLTSINDKSNSSSNALVVSLLCRLSLSLCCPVDINEEKVLHNKRRARLATALLVRLCEDLRVSLRRFFRRRQSMTQTSGLQSPEELIASIQMIIHQATAFDDQICKQDGSIVGLFKSCLKYGVTDIGGKDAAVSAACLSLIRTLVIKVSSASSTLVQLSGLLHPSRIFAMVTTHSKFSAVLTATTALPSTSVKLELVRLLLCCVSLSADRIKFNDELWSMLLAGYNAGVGEVDCTLRRLFHVYSDRTIGHAKQGELPFMHRLKWADAAQHNLGHTDGTSQDPQMGTSDEASGKEWEWFINSLDISRVRATLSQFPVWDHLESPPILDVETWTTTDEKCVEKLHNTVSNHGSSTCEADRSVWRADWTSTGFDNRFSPAFVLPLLFSVLEWFSSRADAASSSRTVAADRNLDDMEVTPSDESSANEHEANRVAFATVAQRLCDKGGICLGLAALCSRCPSVRQVAVATLGLFMRALNSKEALKITAWRDRPQLAMVLNSVQRGLAVRRAMQLFHMEGSSQKTKSDLLVPMLPAVSAVFLARASLIVGKPGDALFAPMNRYFLRIEEACGAYRDVNRLPAFMSLFCSSSDELGQARRERLWALQQLKDGFVDEYCYRAVASCHAPELLMTAFDSYDSRQTDGDGELERTLLLETLTTIVARGGSRAARHMFGRIGLLSWIRAVLLGRPMFELLPTDSCRTAFLRLISVSVKKLLLAEDTMDFGSSLQEISDLASPVLQLYTSSSKTCRFERREHDAAGSADNVVASICDALHSLKEAAILIVKRDPSARIRHTLGVRPNGMLLSTVAALVSDSPEPLLGRTIGALCCLPVRFDSQCAKDASLFCESILKFVVHESGEDLSLAVHVLKRVSLLSPLFGSTLDPEGRVISLVLACRRIVVGNPEVLYEWVECLSNLKHELNETAGVDNAAAIANAIVYVQKQQY